MIWAFLVFILSGALGFFSKISLATLMVTRQLKRYVANAAASSSITKLYCLRLVRVSRNRLDDVHETTSSSQIDT